MRSRGFLIDCHSDLMIDVFRRRRLGERNVLASVHLPRLREGGVGALVAAVGGDAAVLCPLGLDRAYESMLAMIEALRADAAESGGAVAVAVSASELEELAAAGVLAVLPSLEGAFPVEGRLDRLAELHALGVRAIGLTWNSRNELAVGLDAGEGGLTELGAAAVREMNRLGIAVDVSHLSVASFWGVVRASEAPFMASHSNARALWDHPRNLDDEQLDAVAARGGLVGVVLYPGFVGAVPVSVEHVLDHAEYLLERVGPGSVAIGADFIDYALEEAAADLEQHSALYHESEFVYPEGLEDCRYLGNLLAGLEVRGRSPEQVAAVASGNFLRFLRDVESAAAR